MDDRGQLDAARGLKADMIETGAWAGNVNSIKSIEVHGFRCDREALEWNSKRGRHERMRHYTLARADWLRLA